MRIGISGQGFGRNLLNTLLTRDDCVVTAVSDHFPKRLEFAKSRNILTWQDDAEMIREAEIDAVVLTSAPHVRGAGLSAAIERGLPVFLEKPIAGTVTQARDVVKMCADHPVFVGFSFRFHNPVQRLIQELPSLGAPRLLNAEYMFDWLPDSNWLWDKNRGGGFFNENSCHLFDVVNQIMGAPATVYAAGFDNGERPSATGAALTLSYDHGGVAALTLGGVRGSSALDDFPRLDLACENGRAQMQGRQHMWTGLRWAGKEGDVQSLSYDPETLNRSRYSDAFDHFFTQIKQERPFVSTPQDGFEAVELADAVYRSIESGAPVKLGDTK